MRVRPVILAVAGALAGVLALSACATGTAPDARITPKTQVNNPALATLPDVPVIPDLTYTTDAGIPQKLDVCTPPDSVTADGTGPYPAIVEVHGGSWARGDKADLGYRAICQWLASAGYVTFDVDYRLAPGSKFPASLNDCEWAYRSLLDRGFNPSRIVIIGESAGGNLTLGLLHRLRAQGLPRPACAVPISPVTEMARIHGLPSRTSRMKQDPLLPVKVMHRVHELYVGDWDSADPELSPLVGDLKGFPPLFLLASDNEILRDDTVAFARKAREAGVYTKMEIWPTLPHAFPLFEQMFPEVREARKDIVEFMRENITTH